MNRREFVGKLCAGVVGACVVAKVPLKWVPAGVKRNAAQDFMTRSYNAYIKGSGSKHQPDYLVASDSLFEAYEGELECFQRFVPGDTSEDMRWPPAALAFKASKLYKGRQTNTWELNFYKQGREIVTYSTYRLS